MKILHISTYQRGGAAIAANRLHQALIANGHDSKFLFLECKETDSFFKYKKRNYLTELFLKFTKKFDIPLSIDEYKAQKYKEQCEMFSFASTSYIRMHEHPLIKEADIINLHWVANFVDHDTFFRNINKPIVWTLHDMQPFQGGFHYKEDEVRNLCTLNSLDRKQYEIKKKALSQKEMHSITVVAPSQWLLQLSEQSDILGKFIHKHIPYGINLGIFKVADKAKSKQKLDLPKDKVIILFVAENLNNHRKGFEMISELIKDESISSRCGFMAVGKVEKAGQVPAIKYLGTISDEKEMSLIYNAADIFIIPSREDNLPNTMIESLCCGTPVVGFSIGGVKESITNYENGILAGNISVNELKKALLACINNISQFNRIKISATAHMYYASELQLNAYLEVYTECLYQKTIEA